MSDHLDDADLRAATRAAILGLPLPKRRALTDDQLIEGSIDSLAACRAVLKVYAQRVRHLTAMRSQGPMDETDRADLELLCAMNPLRRKPGQKALRRTPQLEQALAEVLPTTKEIDDQ
jgi:hypothetical protein